MALPLLAGCLALLGTGVVGRRGPRALAGVTPAATYLVLTLVQLALWEGVVVPFLGAPPLFST